jgi:microcystin-dependent protein
MAVGIVMPKGKVQVENNNGAPLSLGTIDFYIPGTTTRKNTWSDADCTVLNTNPVVLDVYGRASIYGVGDYRQVVKDSLGNTLWDQVVSGALDPPDAQDVEISPIAGFSSITNVQDFLEAIVAYFVPPGLVAPTAGAVPSGWLECNGAAVGRTTYPSLFEVLVTNSGFTDQSVSLSAPSQAMTVTIASPGVVTATAHGLAVNDRVKLTTTGALPTGLAAATYYYVAEVLTANTITLKLTDGGAAINTSGTQSGTHTLWKETIFTKAAHGFIGNERLRFTNTAGAFPTGMDGSTDYFVEVIDANNFGLKLGDRDAITSLVCTSAGSGTFTYLQSWWGLGNGTTTFLLPDLRSEFIRGASTAYPVGIRQVDQIKTHAITGVTNAGGAHEHDIAYNLDVNNYQTPGAANAVTNLVNGGTGGNQTRTTDTSPTHTHGISVTYTGGTETNPRNIPMKYMIKT